MSKNPNTSRGKWRASDGIEYPVVDAEPGTVILIQPTEADIACAVARDPRNCALAQAWKRQVNVPVAQIGIDKCYLPMRLNGEVVALRVKTTSSARRHIDAFDKTGEFPAEGIMLRGIPEHERLESRRSAAKRDRVRWETVGRPPIKRRKSIHLRSATHPASS